MNYLFRKFESIQIKLLLSFSVIAILISSILSLVLYINFEKSALDLVYQSNTKLLSEISYSSTYMNDLGRNLCTSIFLGDDAIPLMYSKSEDAFKIGNAIRKLDISTAPAPYIESVYLYNRYLNMFISTSTNRLYDSVDFYDKEVESIIDHINRTGRNISLTPIPRKIPMIDVASNHTDYINVYSYFMYEFSNNVNQLDGATILNIKEDWLRNTITAIYSNTMDKNSSVFIIDNKGTIVSHSSPQMFLKSISNESYINKILTAKDNSGFFVSNIDNKKYLVTYVTSSAIDWKFISLTPYQVITSTVKDVKSTTVIFCIIALFLGLIFSAMLSRKIYNPIGTLVDNVMKRYPFSTSTKKNNNEISFLTSAFSQVADKADSLEDLKRNNIQTLKNDFLKKLLNGNCTISYENIDSKLAELDIGLRLKDRILLCILKIDHYKDFINSYSENDRALYKFAITNISSEVIGRYYENATVDMDNDHICILLNIDHDSEQIPNKLNNTIKTCISEIQNYIRSHFHISLSAFVGYISENIYKINTSYTEALNISLYRIKFGHGCIIFPENLNEINDDNFVFPTAKEKLLLDAIRLTNFKQAKEAYEEIIAMLSNCSYDNIISSLLYLTFSIYNCVNSIEKNSSYKVSTDFSTLNAQISNLETLEQANDIFTNLFQEIINDLGDSKGKKSDKIINNITSIVNSNYHDKNLCLNTIASSMKMSPAYLGRMFKEATSKSVAEYITEVKLEKVKNLIDTTDLSLIKILDKCGLEKTTYFYTSFKKHFGVSLSEYKFAKTNKILE